MSISWLLKFCKMSPLGETGQSVQGISVLFFKIACGPTVISNFQLKKPKQPNLLKVRTRGCKPRWVNSKAHPQPLSLHTDDVGSLNNTSRSDTSWFTSPSIPSATSSCLALQALFILKLMCSFLLLPFALASLSAFNIFTYLSSLVPFTSCHKSFLGHLTMIVLCPSFQVRFQKHFLEHPLHQWHCFPSYFQNYSHATWITRVLYPIIFTKP